VARDFFLLQGVQTVFGAQ